MQPGRGSARRASACPPRFTLGLGVAEIVGSVSLVLGAYPRVGAIPLIGVMLGAIYKKMFVWKTGLWGEKGQGSGTECAWR